MRIIRAAGQSSPALKLVVDALRQGIWVNT
jgi:hypothetical protein